MIHERTEDEYCLFTGGLPLQQFGCDWSGGHLHPCEVREHRRRNYWEFPSDNSCISLWVLCERLLTISEADGGNIPMNTDILWEKFSQIGIKTVQHLFQYFYIGTEERPNYKEVQDLVDDFSDVNFTISLKLSHYARACSSMMTHRYQEDHKFFIRCMQQPRDYRVKVQLLVVLLAAMMMF